jgi:hypothetical protein
VVGDKALEKRVKDGNGKSSSIALVKWSAVMGLLMTLAGTGCGPIVATSSIARAENLVTEAGSQYAEQYATYHYISAVEYLEKAREEWGYSDYQAAHEYATRALDQARAAIDRVRNRTDALGNPLPAQGTPAPNQGTVPSAPAVPPSSGDVFRPVTP